MAYDISELEKQIAEKNLLLDSLSNKPDVDSDELERVIKELDTLLYLYYKSLKPGNDTAVFCCRAS